MPAWVVRLLRFSPLSKMTVLKNNDVLERDQSGMTECLAEMLGPDVARNVIKDIYRGERARIVKSRINQAEIAKQNAGDLVGVDGLGELKAEIDERAYHYWGQKLGYACWSDVGFVREFLRDNPDVRVKNIPRPNQSGWRSEGIVLTDKRGMIKGGAAA